MHDGTPMRSAHIGKLLIDWVWPEINIYVESEIDLVRRKMKW